MKSISRVALCLALLVVPTLVRGAAPRAETDFFNGKDLAGWSGLSMQYWSVEDGAIVGRSKERVPQNEFLWSPIEVKNFYLSVDLKLEPNEGNAGIQFRSQKLPPHEALGYQADAGKDVWGRLYHESGRKKLDWRDRGEAAVKPGEWNRYEILAVGDRIWTAINGKLAVSVRDPEGERSGYISFQIHAGGPIEARYRINALVHDPRIELAGMNEQQLNAELIAPLPPEAAKKAAGGKGKAATRPAATKPAAIKAAAVVPANKPTTAPATMPTTVPAERFGEVPPEVLPARKPYASNAFDVESDEVIVFAGQANFVHAQQTGYLESQLLVRFADRRPRFRSMAWEGDTVYEQWRDDNFGGWYEQLTWVGASAVIAQFGQTESFDGIARLPEFLTAYGQLIDQWQRVTPRIVLILPMPFEKPPQPLAPDHAQRNADVRAYGDAIKQLAADRKCLYVDLFAPLSERSGNQRSGLTTNGMHLSTEGQRVVGRLIAQQLIGNRGGLLPDERLEPLRQEVVNKNRLWFDNWRPMNWAFAYGNRTQMPFGKPGGGKPALRIEFEEFKPLIVAADQSIQKTVMQVAETALISAETVRIRSVGSIPLSSPGSESTEG